MQKWEVKRYLDSREISPWSVKKSRAKANRVLPRECIGHGKHPLPTAQEKTLHMDITRSSTLKSDCLYSLQPKIEKLYTVNKNKTRSWLWLRLWTPYCQIQTEIEESRDIINVSVDEKVMDENGKVDIGKLRPITFDPFNMAYVELGAKAGNAFSDGRALKKW